MIERDVIAGLVVTAIALLGAVYFGWNLYDALKNRVPDRRYGITQPFGSAQFKAHVLLQVVGLVLMPPLVYIGLRWTGFI